jgi:hypothetical protein
VRADMVAEASVVYQNILSISLPLKTRPLLGVADKPIGFWHIPASLSNALFYSLFRL